MEEKIITDERKLLLKQVAMGIVDGTVFCSVQLKNKRDLISVFMVLLWLKKEDLKNVAFAYESYSAAGPISINGYPTFMSAKFIFMHEVEYFSTQVDEYAKVKDWFLTHKK